MPFVGLFYIEPSNLLLLLIEESQLCFHWFPTAVHAFGVVLINDEIF